MGLPGFPDVLRARRTIAPFLPATPLYHYQSLSDALGAEVWVKHENHLPTGAFKVRGGVNFMAHLPPEQRARGVITASTGNHGLSVAYSARLFDAHAVIAMPVGANPAKVEAIRDLGAEVRMIEDFDGPYAEETAKREGMRFLAPADEPLLIAGVGTYSLEIFEALPDVEVIIVPVSTGTGASGTCLVAKKINPRTRVVGIQSEAAPSAYLSWKEKRPVEAPSETFAEGLAASRPFGLPQEILQRSLDEFVLVGEDELKSAVLLAIEKTHNLVEAAGAASLAGALKIRERLRGKRIVLVMSGGNITLMQLMNLSGTTS